MDGLGGPNPFGAYLVGPTTALLNYALGAHWSLMAYLFVIGLVILTGAARAFAVGSTWYASVALAIIALYNPWTYNEIVAGHLPMVLAFGITLHLVGELRRETPRPLVLSLAILISSIQIQFFLANVLLLIIHGRTLRLRLPLLSAAIALAPMAVGVLTAAQWLQQIPILRSWQFSQSVPLTRAVFLGGYSAGYAHSLPSFESWLIGVVIAFAAIGLFCTSSWRDAILPIFGVAVLLFVTGLRGPIAPLYEFLLEHVHAIGVFRELYDLVAYLIVAYLFLVARAASRIIAIRLTALPIGLLFLSAWWIGNPAKYWVDVAELPHVHAAVKAHTRFALLPPFQPLKAHGRGSGIDPDAYARPGDVTPLNTYVPAYPANFALSRWISVHDPVPLESLSVSTVINRPWLTSDASALASTMPFATAGSPPKMAVHFPHPLAEISFTGPLPVVDLPPLPWDSAIFYADDAAAPGAFHVFTVTGGTLDYRSGWVDARLLFEQFPNIAQPWGGVLTSSTRPFAVSAHTDLLIDVRGKLLDQNGDVIAGSTGGYHWVSTPARSSRVHCQGFCVLLASGDPPALPHRAPLLRPQALHGGTLGVPWIVVTSVPASAAGTIRLNNAFAPGWLAFEGFHLLRHVRIDGIVNGWITPAFERPRRVVMLYIPALLQLIAALAMWVWFILLLQPGRLLSAVLSYRARWISGGSGAPIEPDDDEDVIRRASPLVGGVLGRSDHS